ncbi:hypothetical protein [Pantoea agglomerans]|uniref:hypothetical protein n=1 Tax=Enterobacter agglomerans TaxID=549 RepID=UPI001F5B96EA|nr:hypothetical protein [Pantoea agglomerans]
MFILNWLLAHHIPSIATGIVSALFWVISATVKSKLNPGKVMITFNGEQDDVDLHNFYDTARLQSKYSSIAALAAAATVLSQALGW